MWGGVICGALLEHQGTHILLSGGAQVFLDHAEQCDFPVGIYLRVTYREIGGRKFARDIAPSDAFEALDGPDREVSDRE
jgi:hypothetical protein